MRKPVETLKELEKIILEFFNTFRFVNFFITNACTCRCVMCNFWRKDKAFISDLAFKEAIDILEGLGFYNQSLTGGEPLLHPQYFKFVKYMKRKGLYVNSPTNGTLLTEKNVKRLKESGIDSVSVSIDSLNPEIANRIRGHPGQLRKALNGLRLLKKHGVPISVIIILAKHNIHHFSEMVRRFDEDYDAPSVLCFPDSGIGSLDEIDFTKSELVKVIDELLYLKKQGYRLLNVTEYLLDIKRAYLGEKRRIPCYGGHYVINVYWDGSVTPCFNKNPICNIGELSIDRLQKKSCQLCLNQCFIEFSYISEHMRKKQFFTILKERYAAIRLHF